MNDYEGDFSFALARDASIERDSVTTTVIEIIGESPVCDDAAVPSSSTQVITKVKVPAADLDAVLAVLPPNADTIDLKRPFGVLSLGDKVNIID